MSDDPVPVALHLAYQFERLGIEYWLRGSLASSIHGEPRSTHDVDFVVELDMKDAENLATVLSTDYHVDEAAVREAVRRRSSFQVVHMRDFHRVDVFVKRDDPHADEEQRRRRRVVIDPSTGDSLWVTSAEDIVLQKLAWFRKRGEVSDRQWRDVLGVLKTQPQCDRSHLTRWSHHLGVSDLLERALVEAGLDSP